jgi:hypothetical protein
MVYAYTSPNEVAEKVTFLKMTSKICFKVALKCYETMVI